MDKNTYTEEPRGRGLFLRSVFCAFILLILCSVFALHTDFSEKIKETFKSALTETTQTFVPKALESRLTRSKKENPSGGYLPEEPQPQTGQETYPNPIIMPSEMKTNGSVPSSDL